MDTLWFSFHTPERLLEPFDDREKERVGREIEREMGRNRLTEEEGNEGGRERRREKSNYF